MSALQTSGRKFTGRHMAMIMVGFFTVVVSVNVTMATLAKRSWTGLIVQNAYVASQHFNAETAKREAVLARGDQLEISYQDGRLNISAADKDGQSLGLVAAKLKFYRNIGAQQNPQVDFTCRAMLCEAYFSLSPGNWRGDIAIESAGRDTWHQVVEIIVKED